MSISCCSVSQSLSHAQLFATIWAAADKASLSFIIPQNLLRLMSIGLVMPSNYLILWLPLLLMPSIFPSISAFSDELALCIRWPKYWSFSFSINPSNKQVSAWLKIFKRIFPLETHHREGNGNPLQYPCLENPMDGVAWWAAIYGVAQSQTWLKWLSSSRDSSTSFIPFNF